MTPESNSEAASSTTFGASRALRIASTARHLDRAKRRTTGIVRSGATRPSGLRLARQEDRPPPREGDRPPPPRDGGRRPEGGPDGPPRGFGPPGPPRDGERPMGPFGPGRPGPGGPGGFGFRGPNFDHLRDADPEMFALMQEDQELDRHCRELAAKCRQAPTDQRDAAKKELTQAVSRHFDSRQKRRELELKRLEAELKRLREAVDKRNVARDTILEARVKELLGPATDDDF